MPRESHPGGTPGAPRQRTGGRSRRVVESVFAATVDELQDHGYGQLTLASVAERARVSASTVHRRWPSKAALVADVLIEATKSTVSAPDTGALQTDLRQLTQAISDALARPPAQALLRGMLALPPGDAEEVRTAYWTSRRVVAQALIDRACSRGELAADQDALRVLALISAQLWMYHLVIRVGVTDAMLDQLVADAMTLLSRA